MNEKVKNLCLKCKFYNRTEKVSNCYDENSFQVFCITRKIEAVIINCKRFKEQEAIIIEEETLAEAKLEAEINKELEEKGGNK